MGKRTGSGDDALLQDGLGRIELAALGRSELGELGEFAGPSVRRPESSLARRPGRSSSPRWTSGKSDSDTFLSHTTGAGEPPCWSCVLVLGLWERSSGDSRRGASSFFIWFKAWLDAAERDRLALRSPGGLIGPRCSDCTAEVGIIGSRVGELLLSCSPSVVSRGEHSGPCSLNWGSAPCGHMRQITERRVAMARRLVNECVMIEFGAAAVTRDHEPETCHPALPDKKFLPRMASFLSLLGVGATRRPPRVTSK